MMVELEVAEVVLMEEVKATISTIVEAVAVGDYEQVLESPKIVADDVVDTVSATVEAVAAEDYEQVPESPKIVADVVDGTITAIVEAVASGDYEQVLESPRSVVDVGVGTESSEEEVLSETLKPLMISVGCGDSQPTNFNEGTKPECVEIGIGSSQPFEEREEEGPKDSAAIVSIGFGGSETEEPCDDNDARKLACGDIPSRPELLEFGEASHAEVETGLTSPLPKKRRVLGEIQQVPLSQSLRKSGSGCSVSCNDAVMRIVPSELRGRVIDIYSKVDEEEDDDIVASQSQSTGPVVNTRKKKDRWESFECVKENVSPVSKSTDYFLQRCHTAIRIPSQQSKLRVGLSKRVAIPPLHRRPKRKNIENAENEEVHRRPKQKTIENEENEED